MGHSRIVVEQERTFSRSFFAALPLAVLTGTTFAETLTFTADIPAGGWPMATLGPHTTSAGTVCNGSRDATAQIANPVPVIFPFGTPFATGFQNGLIVGMQGVPANQGQTFSLSLTSAVENIRFSVFDIDGAAGAWQDRVVIQAFDGGTPRPVNVACQAGVGGCPAVIIPNPPFGANQIDAGTTPTGFTAANGQWNVSIPGPVTDFTVLYANHNVPTSTTQFAAISQIGYDCTLIGASKEMSNVNGAGQSPYQVSIDYEFENFGEVALTNLTSLEDIESAFNNPVGPPGISSFPSNATVTGISVVVAGGTVTANAGFNGTSNQELFGAGSSLAPGESATIRVNLDLERYAIYNNQITVSATTPVGGTVTDTSTSGTDPDDGDGDNNPDESVVSVLDTSTLPVSIARIAVTRTADGVLVEWETDAEFGNAGFEIYQQTASSEVQRLGDLIPSKVGSSGAPQAYAALRKSAGTGPLWIADVDSQGKRRWHGPIHIDAKAGKTVKTDKISWTADPDQSNKNAFDGLATELQLLVSKDGVHSIDYADLLDAGFDISGSPQEIAIVGPEGPLPIHVRGNQRAIDLTTVIEFIGTANRTLYSADTAYALTYSAVHARRMRTDARQPSHTSGDILSRHRVEDAPQTLYNFAARDDDPWKAARLFAQSEPVEYLTTLRTFDVGDSASASLRIEVSGGNDFSPEDREPGSASCGDLVDTGSDDHCLLAFVDSEYIGAATFDGFETQVLEFPLAGLSSGIHEVTVVVPGGRGYAFDIVWVESIAVEYARKLRLEDGQSYFPLASSIVGDGLFRSSFDRETDWIDPAISGVATVGAVIGADPSVSVFRVNSGTVTRVQTVEGRDGSLSIPTAPTDRYWVVSGSGFLKPRIQVAMPVSTLPVRSMDYVIIAHSDFIEESERLADFHRARGLSVTLVDVRSVFEVYGSGTPDPLAIRSYLRELARLGLQYALLVGGDTYDYLDHLGTGSVSHVPTMYTATDSVVRYAPADPLLVDFDDDRVPDIPLGRLPVRSVSELRTIVDKIYQFGAGQGVTNVLMIADASEPTANFAQESQVLADAFSRIWDVAQISRDDFLDSGSTESAVVSALSGGPGLVTYLGHSGPRTWFRMPAFSIASVSQLQNDGLPGIYVQWGCWNNYFVDPTAPTLGHRLLTDGPHGAVAVLGASALTESSSEIAFARLLADELSRPGIRLGDAITAAKQALGRETADYSDVVIGWTLLGDPALKLSDL